MKTSRIIIVAMAGLFILLLTVGLLMLKSYLKSSQGEYVNGKKTIGIIQIHK